jgi:hypothetical protein
VGSVLRQDSREFLRQGDELERQERLPLHTEVLQHLDRDTLTPQSANTPIQIRTPPPQTRLPLRSLSRRRNRLSSRNWHRIAGRECHIRLQRLKSRRSAHYPQFGRRARAAGNPLQCDCTGFLPYKDGEWSDGVVGRDTAACGRNA